MNPSRNHHAWHDVAVFENLNDSKALAAILADNGLEARTYDDKFFRYFLFLRPPRITFRVQVREDHFAEANRWLAEKSPAVLDDAIHCPSCGSLRVNYPQMTRKFILPTVLLHLGIIFRIIDHECYCEQCQEIWLLPKKGVTPDKAGTVKPVPL